MGVKVAFRGDAAAPRRRARGARVPQAAAAREGDGATSCFVGRVDGQASSAAPVDGRAARRTARSTIAHRRGAGERVVVAGAGRTWPKDGGARARGGTVSAPADGRRAARCADSRGVHKIYRRGSEEIDVLTGSTSTSPRASSWP